MSDIYNEKYLRRWSISPQGMGECAEDAVDITLISDEDRAAIEERNEWIHAAIEALAVDESPELDALSRLQAGTPEEGDWELVNSTWNYPIEIHVRHQFPDLWPVDFKALLHISGYYQPLLDWLTDPENGMDPIERAFALSKMENSAMYSRYDSMMVQGAAALGITDAEIDGLWAWASSNY